MTTSRRDVLTTGAKAAAVGAVAAGSLAADSLASASSATASSAMLADPPTEHILTTQLSASTITYNPPLTTAVETHSIHVEITVVGGVTADGRVLQSATLDGNLVRGCSGLVTNPNLHGVLSWTTGPSSAFDIDSINAAGASGHGSGILQGHIVSGPYTNATVKIIAIRRANAITACLTGGTVESATGNDIIVIEN